jgi:hypothetical protein
MRRGRLNQLCEASDENTLSKQVTSLIEFVGGRAPNWFLALLYIAWVVRYATFASISFAEDAHGPQRPISMN